MILAKTANSSLRKDRIEPGEAKGELKKRLIGDEVDERIVRIEATDKMTDRQVASKVREYFLR